MSRAVHVVPLGDLILHPIPGGYAGISPADTTQGFWLALQSDDCLDVEHGWCACGPTPELVQAEGRPDGWVWTHHSLDGRELSEPGVMS